MQKTNAPYEKSNMILDDNNELVDGINILKEMITMIALRNYHKMMEISMSHLRLTFIIVMMR